MRGPFTVVAVEPDQVLKGDRVGVRVIAPLRTPGSQHLEDRRIGFGDHWRIPGGATVRCFDSGFDKDVSQNSWRFLTGTKENIKKVSDAVGYYFKREGTEFRHSGALVFIDKTGKICRYLIPSYTDNHGFGILPFDFKMAVFETSKGKESPTIARVLQFCFSYDPQGKTYALDFTRIFGVAILLFAGIFLLVIKLKPKKEK